MVFEKCHQRAVCAFSHGGEKIKADWIGFFEFTNNPNRYFCEDHKVRIEKFFDRGRKKRTS